MGLSHANDVAACSVRARGVWDACKNQGVGEMDVGMSDKFGESSSVEGGGLAVCVVGRRQAVDAFGDGS